MTFPTNICISIMKKQTSLGIFAHICHCCISQLAYYQVPIIILLPTAARWFIIMTVLVLRCLLICFDKLRYRTGIFTLPHGVSKSQFCNSNWYNQISLGNKENNIISNYDKRYIVIPPIPITKCVCVQVFQRNQKFNIMFIHKGNYFFFNCKQCIQMQIIRMFKS